jgi:hypothetical protein
MRCNEDCNLLKTGIFESATQPLIPDRAGHTSEIQPLRINTLGKIGLLVASSLTVPPASPTTWPVRLMGLRHC